MWIMKKKEKERSRSPTETQEARHEFDKDRVLVLIELTKTSLSCQEETLQPIDAILINQTKPPNPDNSNQDIFHETSYDLATLLDDTTRESEEGDKEKEVPKETIDDPIQEEKEKLLEDVGEKSLPSPPKSIPEVVTWLDKLKEVVREEKEVDMDYVVQFMDEFICKPLEKGFEDIF
ncbi:hypothetical protein E5676_scaffold388G00470 [Cucumis melo var. makuwa]|uniref:Uncharacterized protein n=2 Tax=Cucumis melo TaxID=3656 RepID=A0A5D3BRW7_CUCMM|nr:hypothetical protein E5676_scaffold388G00470 [Cucumis melo var. makuwa]